MRSGIGVVGSSLMNGAMDTLMAPETVVRRISAGFLASRERWGIMAISIIPEIVLMIRVSSTLKVPTTLLDVSLMRIWRDMVTMVLLGLN